MRVAIYSRVSTIDKGQTLEQQEQPMIRYCQREGWEYTLYKDYASGSRESRPELDKMMQAIRLREFDAVMIHRLDRLGRSLKHLLQLVEEFRNKGVRFICLTQNMDTSTATGEMLFNMLGTIAQFERRLLQERIRDKLAILKEQGKPLGRPKGKKDTKPRRKSGYYLRWGKKGTPHKMVVDSPQ